MIRGRRLSTNLILDKENYELFLMELINNSTYFNQYGKFVHPQSESHGECDAICYSNDNNIVYQFDFKLFISCDEAKQRHINADEIEYDSEHNVKSIHHKRKNKLDESQNNEISFWDLNNLIPWYTFTDLEKIYKNEYIYDDLEIKKVVQPFVNKTLLTKKNLLFLIPICFCLENKSIDSFCGEIGQYFNTMFQFRKSIINYDSYISFFITDFKGNKQTISWSKTNGLSQNLVKSNLVIMKYENKKLVLKDVIDENKSNFLSKNKIGFLFTT